MTAKKRTASIHRVTKETDVTVKLDLDGKGITKIDTGIGFFDHMLDALGRHSGIDLTVKVKGDLEVDGHHSVEDVGIVFGQALAKALGDKAGIRRYGFFLLPMDETLAECALDLGGRPYFVMNAQIPAQRVGSFETELVREFFYAVSYSAAMNLHLSVRYGENSHHIIEALFKSFARALKEAVAGDDKLEGIPSTKGVLL